MSEPRRWKDAPDAPIGVRELLSSARTTRSLDDVARRRNASRVGKLTVAPAAAAAAVGIWTKLAAAGVVGLAAVGTVVTVQAQREAPAPVAASTSPVSSMVPSVKAAPIAVPVAAPVEMQDEPAAEPERVPAHAAAPRASAPVDAPEEEPAPTPAPMAAPTAEPTLAAELSLLEEARAVLARDPLHALAALDSHRRRFPNGELADERDLMELDALRRAGRGADAADRARAWLARDPAGLHSTRVRAILASLEGR
jgi:hypothetical protein